MLTGPCTIALDQKYLESTFQTHGKCRAVFLKLEGIGLASLIQLQRLIGQVGQLRDYFKLVADSICRGQIHLCMRRHVDVEASVVTYLFQVLITMGNTQTSA